MIVTNLHKKALAIFLILLMAFEFIRSGSVNQLRPLAKCALSKESISGLDKSFTENVGLRRSLILINGLVSKTAGLKDYYSNRNIYIDSNRYVVGVYPYTSTDFEYEQTVNLYDFLSENGINLLYIDKPVKYIDDDYTAREFGVESYSNRNADLFLSRIKDAGVPVIDLRKELTKDGLNIKDMFYRTDHHWTAPAGFWASKKMAEGLNRYCGYNIDLSIYDDGNYDFTYYDNCWVGEQGKLLGESYIGRDNYTLIRPNFETSYTMTIDGEITETDFNSFINDYTFSDTNVDEMSWHYAYKQYNNINHNVDYGKVLMLTDSYDAVTVPFVSLGVHEVNSILRRELPDDFDLKKYILDGDYDTVIISYAEFMIGAHDNPDSANYRMFMF